MASSWPLPPSAGLDALKAVEDQQNAAGANGNGSFGPSPLRAAFKAYWKMRWMAKLCQELHQKLAPGAQEEDQIVELLLTDGKVEPPYRAAFAFCTLDRWFDPDCCPGILSKVYLPEPRLS